MKRLVNRILRIQGAMWQRVRRDMTQVCLLYTRCVCALRFYSDQLNCVSEMQREYCASLTLNAASRAATDIHIYIEFWSRLIAPRLQCVCVCVCV